MTSPTVERHASLTGGTPKLDGVAAPTAQRPGSPKRKSSEVTATATPATTATATTTAAATPAENGGDGKKKRRKVNHACVYCRRSHMTCDLERPCARCVKRDIGHLCHDEPRDPPKRRKSEVSVAEIAPAPDESRADLMANGNGIGGGASGGGGAHYGQQGSGDMANLNGSTPAIQQQLPQAQPTSPTQLQRPPLPTASSSGGGSGGGGGGNSNMSLNFDWNNTGLQNQFHDVHHLHPNNLFNTTEVTNEYNLLNDFLSSSLQDDEALYRSDDVQALFNDPLLASSSVSALTANLQQHQLLQQQQQHSQQRGTADNQQSLPFLQPAPPAKAGEEIARPPSTFSISDKARDKFYMTAADPAGLSSAADRLQKLLKAKYDAGMLRPFNYVKGYARLQKYMTEHLHPANQRRILEQLGHFRPKFREAMHSLTDMQLVLVEMWFENSLMEYDRVFASMAIPACCWRRTGEIFRGNREMAELIKVPMERLRDGRLAIHEIIAEESLASYWEKFGAIAFDQSQKAILTSCVLKTPSSVSTDSTGGASSSKTSDGVSNGNETKQDERVRCCFSFTIRRDSYNIPSLIVGNFLPIRPRSQQ